MRHCRYLVDCVVRFTNGSLCDAITTNQLGNLLMLDLDYVTVVGKYFVRSKGHVVRLLCDLGDFYIEVEVVPRLYVTVCMAQAAIVM